MAGYLERTEARAREPWRASRDAHRAALQGLMREPEVSKERHRKLAIDLARNHELTPREVMELSYSIFGSDYDRIFYNNILLNKHGADRVRAHNWYLAELQGDQFIDQFGERIQGLAWPLFPTNEEAFSSLNTRLLSGAIEGAGEPHEVPAVYKQQRDDLLGGETIVPVLPNGTIDITFVETAFKTLEQQVTNSNLGMQQLQQQLQALQSSPQLSSSGLRQNFQPNSGKYGWYRGRGGQRRGTFGNSRGRGSGGDAEAVPRAGEAAEKKHF